MMAQAYEKGDFVLRLGAVNVETPTQTAATLTCPAYRRALHTEVGDDTQFGVIPMYMVTDTVGIELLAATPFEHDITPQRHGVNLNAASTKQLPPTISAQWYPRGGKEAGSPSWA